MAWKSKVRAKTQDEPRARTKAPGSHEEPAPPLYTTSITGQALTAEPLSIDPLIEVSWQTKILGEVQDESAARTTARHLPATAPSSREGVESSPHETSISPQPPMVELLSPSPAAKLPGTSFRAEAETTAASPPLSKHPAEDPPLYRASTDPTPSSSAPPVYSILDPSTFAPPKKPRMHFFKAKLEDARTKANSAMISIEDSNKRSAAKAACSVREEARDGVVNWWVVRRR
ncbi:hypothetical protein PMIN06_003676 [Paraphaeosphaeria minitans]